MIIIDEKSNTTVIKGGKTVILNELLNIVALITEKGNVKKESLRKILNDDGFWDSIECDEDEEE